MQIDHAVTIAQPVDRVFDYASRVEYFPIWVSSVIKAERTSDGPMGLGATFVEDLQVLGRQLQIPAKVTRFDPPSHISYESTGGAIKYEMVLAFEPHGSSTVMSVVADYEPTGMFALAETLMKQFMTRAMTNDLETLKDLLELQGT